MTASKAKTVYPFRQHRRTGAAAVAGLIAFFPIAGANAEERVEWSSLTFVHSTADADRAQSVISLFGGFAFNRKGGLFLDALEMHTLVAAGGLANAGVKSLTSPEGEQLFIHYQVADVDPSAWSGRWTIVGGSGRFREATGGGTFVAAEVWNGSTVLEIYDGVYELPVDRLDQFGPFGRTPNIEDDEAAGAYWAATPR